MWMVRQKRGRKTWSVTGDDSIRNRLAHGFNQSKDLAAKDDEFFLQCSCGLYFVAYDGWLAMNSGIYVVREIILKDRDYTV